MPASASKIIVPPSPYLRRRMAIKRETLIKEIVREMRKINKEKREQRRSERMAEIEQQALMREVFK
jgi:hypothetical protein